METPGDEVAEDVQLQWVVTPVLLVFSETLRYN